MVNSWLKQFGLTVWSILVAIGSIWAYEKYIDKPDTVVNNDIGKIKNKGQNNEVDATSNTEVSNDNKEVKNKPKFRLFKKR